jgi:hypothetical protein
MRRAAGIKPGPHDSNSYVSYGRKMVMNAKQLEQKLIGLRACQEAREWAKGKTLAQAWKTCERGDWMLWLAVWLCDRKLVVLAVCDCAELALKYVPDGETRPKHCIDTARAWVAGKATLKEVKAAAHAASSAAHAAHAYAADAAAADAAAARYPVLKQCADLVRVRIKVGNLTAQRGG